MTMSPLGTRVALLPVVIAGDTMKKLDQDLQNTEEELLSTEMIELTCDDLDSLTRAFEMISDLCQSLEVDLSDGLDEPIPPRMIN